MTPASLVEQIRRDRGMFCLLAPLSLSEQAAACPVLEVAVEHLATTNPHLEFVEGPDPAPTGLAISGSLDDVSDRVVGDLIAYLSAAAAQAGSTLAAVAAPGRSVGLMSERKHALLVQALLPDAPRESDIPALLDWLTAAGSETLTALVGTGEFTLTSPLAAHDYLLAAVHLAGASTLVAGDITAPERVITLTRKPFPSLAFGVRQPAPDELIQPAWQDLVATARTLASRVTHAWAAPYPSWMEVTDASKPQTLPWASGRQVSPISDLVILQPAPWLILGPGHRQRLSARGTGLTIVRELGEGMCEVETGPMLAWLEPDDRDHVCEQARQALAGLLVTQYEAAMLRRQRDGAV